MQKDLYRPIIDDDSSEAINKAIKYAHKHLASGVTNVIFSSGHYYITNQIKINPYIRVELKGTVVISVLYDLFTPDEELFYDCNGNLVAEPLDWVKSNYYIKRQVSSNEDVLYRYTKAAMLVSYDNITDNDEAITDTHPFFTDSTSSSANKNSYIIGGDGNLLINTQKSKTQEQQEEQIEEEEAQEDEIPINANKFPSYLVGLEIGTADTAYRKNKYSHPGEYNNIRFEKITIHSFSIGILAHTTNFYSNRFSNVCLWGNYVGFQFGFKKESEKADREVATNSGELIIFKDSVFTGNVIDAQLNMNAAEIDFDSCHFDFSLCAVQLNSYEKVIMDKCHIEGIGRTLVKMLSSDSTSLDGLETSGSIVLSDYEPYGIFFTDVYSLKMFVEIHNSIIVDQIGAFFPMFVFNHPRSGSDGFFENRLILDKVMYGVSSTHITSFKCNQYDGIGSATGYYMPSGFLTSDVAGFPFDPSKKMFLNATNRNSIPLTCLVSRKDRTDTSAVNLYSFSMRPLNNKSLLLKNTYFQNVNECILRGTDGCSGTIVGASPTDADVPINFRAFDANAKYINIINNSQAKKWFPIDIEEDIYCSYGETLYGQVVANKVQWDCFDVSANEPKKAAIMNHRIEFIEYDEDNEELGRYTYAVAHFVSDNEINDITINKINEKFPYPLTTAAVHSIKNRDCKKIRVTVLAGVSSQNDYPNSGSSSVQIHAVFIYKQ